eukprot:11980-Heterococcus_DN1.PRE.2
MPALPSTICAQDFALGTVTTIPTAAADARCALQSPRAVSSLINDGIRCVYSSNEVSVVAVTSATVAADCYIILTVMTIEVLVKTQANTCLITSQRRKASNCVHYPLVSYSKAGNSSSSSSQQNSTKVKRCDPACIACAD